jgi:hypothetical protein
MADELKDWKSITPGALIPGIEHIRKSFQSADWNYSGFTRVLCRSALYPDTKDPDALPLYEAAFSEFRKIIGRAAGEDFDHTRSIGTPPSIFRAYFDAYHCGLKAQIGKQFEQIFQVALANVQILDQHPVEWSKAHLGMLIEEQGYDTRVWIRNVCEKQDSSQPMSILDGGDEAAVWKDWRAPKLIHMHPAGNTRYDPATAWIYEDAAYSSELLHNRARRFVEFLEIHLEKIVGAASVRYAQQKPPSVQSTTPVGQVSIYPGDFPSEARNQVEVAILRATKGLAQRRNEVPPVNGDEENLRKYILQVFLVFAEQACALGSQGRWAVDRIRSEALEFLRLFTIRAYYQSGFDRRGRKLREMISNWNGAILPDVQREFEKSAEWQQFEDELLTVGERQIQVAGTNPPSDKRPISKAGRETNSIHPPKDESSQAHLLSNYRSELKRGILIQLTRNPRASDLEICHGLDADGAAELPDGWKLKTIDRSFVQAYRDSRLRHRIEIAISRVRTDLRKQGLLNRT